MMYVFDDCILDVQCYLLSRTGRPVNLRPKAFQVLQYLLQHRDRVVTKQELAEHIWPEQFISDAVLESTIRAVRRALGDDSHTQSYIQTLRGYGYRFVAIVEERAEAGLGETSPPGGASQAAAVRAMPEPASLPVSLSPTPPAHVFGREGEFAQLSHGVQQAWDGHRRFVFVSGEPGIGKTTLVNAFVERLAAQSALCIARGQCMALYGEGEAYLPILEAFGRLGREAGDDQFCTILDQYAPTWLAQMPPLLAPHALLALQQRVQGATPQRMLREMAEALEMLTVHRPLLLVLEDLHWSDVSTLQLLTWLALRSGPARLYILGTFRPVEVGHPLAQMVNELCRKGVGRELALPPLREEAVAAYLATRGGDGVPLPPPQLGRALVRRTGGNPLFMVHLVDYLTAHGWAGMRGDSQTADALAISDARGPQRY